MDLKDTGRAFVDWIKLAQEYSDGLLWKW